MYTKQAVKKQLTSDQKRAIRMAIRADMDSLYIELKALDVCDPLWRYKKGQVDGLERLLNLFS